MKELPSDYYFLLDLCDGDIEKLYYKTQYVSGKITIYSRIIKKEYLKALITQGKSYKEIEEEMEISKCRLSGIKSEITQEQAEQKTLQELKTELEKFKQMETTCKQCQIYNKSKRKQAPKQSQTNNDRTLF